MRLDHLLSMEKVTWLKETAGQKSKEKLLNDEIGYRTSLVVRFSETVAKTAKKKADKRTTHRNMGV